MAENSQSSSKQRSRQPGSTLRASAIDWEDVEQTPRQGDSQQEGGRRLSLNDPITISVYSPSNAEASPIQVRAEGTQSVGHAPSPPRSLREPREQSRSSRSRGSSSDPPPLPRVTPQQAHEDESTVSSGRRARQSQAVAIPLELLDDTASPDSSKQFTAVDPFAPRRHRLSWSSILKVKDGRRRPVRSASDAWTHPNIVYPVNAEDRYAIDEDIEERNSSEEAVLDGERTSGGLEPDPDVNPRPPSIHPSTSSASLQSAYHSFEEEKLKKTTTFQDTLPVYNHRPNGIPVDDTGHPAPSIRLGKQVTVESIPINNLGASDTTSEAQEISLFAWLLAYFPSRMYLYFLLGVPRLYFTRVANIFEDANLQKDQMERLVLEHASARRNPKLPAFHSQAFTLLTASWTHFIDTLLREWKTMNLISVLLLSAIVAILQIEAAFQDPIVHYAALFSLISALMSLLYGCMYILRFNTMRMPHKAIQWAQEARKEQPNPFWNVWILLAIPAVSLIFYILCIMAFVWRVESGKTPPQFSEQLVLAIRIGISVALGVGIVYGAVVIRTFISFGAAMDKRYKKTLDAFMKAQKLTRSHSQRSTNKDGHARWFQDQLTYRDHYSDASLKSRTSRPSMYSANAYPPGFIPPNLPPPQEKTAAPALAAARARAPHSHVHFKHSLDQVKVMTPVQEGLGTPQSNADILTHSPLHMDMGIDTAPHTEPSTAQEPPSGPTAISTSSTQNPSHSPTDQGTPTSPDHRPSIHTPQGPLSNLSLPLFHPAISHSRGATSSSTSTEQATSSRNSPSSQRLPARRLLQPRRADTLPAQQTFRNMRSLEEGHSHTPQDDQNLPGPSRIQVSSTPLLAHPQATAPKGASPQGSGLGIAVVGNPSPWPKPPPVLRSKSAPDPLSFSSDSGPPYDALLPHSPHKVIYCGVQYPSSLHVYHALPFLEHHTDVVERIRMCNDPAELRLLSRNFATYLPPEDLEVTSDKIMEIQSLKFRQHGNLAKLLLGTGDRSLIFCDSEDLILGVDRDGNGKNELGKVLMIVRDSLKEGIATHERATTR